MSSCCHDLCQLTDGPGKLARSHQQWQAMGNISCLRGATPRDQAPSLMTLSHVKGAVSGAEAAPLAETVSRK